METFLTVLHIASCILLVLVVLIQSGKGAEISASFGGSSQTVFGSGGGANFFTKLTASLATIFMVTSIWLTMISADKSKSVLEGVAPPTKPVTLPTDSAEAAGARESSKQETAPVKTPKKK